MTLVASVLRTATVAAKLSLSPYAMLGTAGGDPLVVQSFHDADGIRESFFREHLDDANHLARQFRVHAAVILAQMAYESGWGRSVSVQDGCNGYFGVKASSPSPHVREMLERSTGWTVSPVRTREYATSEVVSGERVRTRAGFSCYSTSQDAMAYYVWMLANKDRYKDLRQFLCPYHQVMWIWLSGYATSDRYFHSAASIIRRITGKEIPQNLRLLATEASGMDAASRAELRPRIIPSRFP